MVGYDKNSIQVLTGGYGAASVIKVTEHSTGKHFVLKRGTPEQNVNAVLVSEFLKQVLSNQGITVQEQSYQFYTPTVTIDTDLDGNVVQKQEYLDKLQPTISGKKIQGLASVDSLREAARLGAVYQFLMLGDNISHNNRITPNGQFNIFDFDSAIILGGSCVTSPDGIFADKVTSVDHAYNDHFIDILALRFKKDKYNYIRFDKAAVNELGNEKWEAFLLGAKEGLELIKANITEDFILQQWGKDIPAGNEAYRQKARTIAQQRLASIDNNIEYLNAVLNGKRQIPGIDIKEPIKNTLAQQSNVTTFLDGVKETIAAEILKPTPKIVLRQEQKVDLSQLKPVTYENGPSERKSLPGRVFKFNEHFKKAGINFATDIHTMSTAVAILTSTKVDEQGFHHPCSCNGPHHALIVAKFSYMVVGEMLTHLEMRIKINKIIEGLGSEAQTFLTKDNHKNYKKIIEIMALLHDTGRPSDGIDQWDETNELNVIHNIEYLLTTTNLSERAIANILNEVKSGIENKDNLNLFTDDGFLFGAPLGAGDSLHSGHAFHGGLWDNRSYDPDYVRLCGQYPGFRENFQVLVSEVEKFVPAPTAQNGGKLAAVNNYLNWHQCHGDGESIIKSAFSNIIYEEFSACDPQQFPIMFKHFGSEKILTEQISTQPNPAEGLKIDMVSIFDITISTLYRIAELLIKAVVGLFVGIGMVLGSLVGQGLAKSEHRQKFANTFFTLNQTDESKSLNKFKQNILDDEMEQPVFSCSSSNLI